MDSIVQGIFPSITSKRNLTEPVSSVKGGNSETSPHRAKGPCALEFLVSWEVCVIHGVNSWQQLLTC